MKSKLVRSIMAVLGVAAVLVALVAANPAPTTAANLTGGQYTYLIDGEEVTFTFDPIVRKDGLLLPLEVFQKIGATVEGATSRIVTVTKSGVVARLTIGSTTYDLAAQAKTLATAPLRLNGRLFLPSDLLREFGVDFTQDGNFVSLKSYSDKSPQPKQFTEDEWNLLRNKRTLSSNVKSDSGSFMNAEFSVMNADMINAANLPITYGNRARLLGMMQANTLILVKLSNQSNRSGGLVTSGTFLVDDRRNQYDVQAVLDIGNGLLSNKLAPGADRIGVLVYPKIASDLSALSVYYDNNGAIIGIFPDFK